MTAFELPEEYRDWVEVQNPTFEKYGKGPFLNVILCRGENGIVTDPFGSMLGARVFVPPKPKPTLPDVKPGGVIGYTDRDGVGRRLMRGSDRWFDQYSYWTDGATLNDVNDDGFTVLLEGE